MGQMRRTTAALTTAWTMAIATLAACSGDSDDTDAAAGPIDTLAEAWSADDAKAFGSATDADGPAGKAFTDMNDELLISKAQVSHGISACMSAVSIVAPAHMRRPDGASR